MRWFLRKLLGTGRLYSIWRRSVSGLVRWRKGLRNVHPTAFVHRTAEVRPDLRMDEYAFVNLECQIMGGVHIGRYSMLAPRVAVVGADHNFHEPGVPMIFSGRPAMPRTEIGADCWIGFGVVVMQGVTIGRGAIVGANSVVTRDIPPYEIWGGIPARRIRDRFESEEARRIHDRMLDGPPVPPSWAEPV